MKNFATSFSLENSSVVETRHDETDMFRFSGHQTFPLRIAWLPKAVSALKAGDDPLTDTDQGIVKLGLGKNMVEALRCWVGAFQIAHRANNKWSLTPVGQLLFDPQDGVDPYFEDVSTAWVLHWMISTNFKDPFFAWECLFNRWPSSEFTASQVVQAFEKESSSSPRPASSATLRQHWEVFIHTYRPPKAGRGEDHLDSALSVLRLIEQAGERPNSAGKWEPLFSFNLGRKTSLPQQLFTFFIHDWWNNKFPSEQTVPLKEVVLGEHSPGRILKMQESEVLARLSELSERQSSNFQIVESTSLRQLRRLKAGTGLSDLRAAYKSPTFV